MKTNSSFKLVGIAALLILGGLFSTISLEHGQEDINVIATIQADLPNSPQQGNFFVDSCLGGDNYNKTRRRPGTRTSMLQAQCPWSWLESY